MPRQVAEWGWNTEKCPKTNRLHYQGYMRTREQCRLAALTTIFPGVHFEVARDWPALVQYCKKAETRVPGTEPVSAYQDFPDMFGYSEDLATRLPNWDEVRELWMKDTELKMALCRRRQASSVELGLVIYDTPELFAYETLLKEMIQMDVVRGQPVEFIVQNPLFITMWKNRIKDLIFRKNFPMSPPPSILDRQTDTVTISFD
jgi:hypothetical protein